MMKKHVACWYFLFTISALFGHTDTLTPLGHAYLFHTIKKSPILDQHIGRYFDYRGEPILLANMNPNYDSIEKKIIENPSLLDINKAEIRKSSKGIVIEAANRVALWEFNKMVHAYASKNDSLCTLFSLKYELFEQMLIRSLPMQALEKQDGKTVLRPRILTILNPNIAINEKITQLLSLPDYTPHIAFETVQSIDKVIEEYIEEQTKQIYQFLGGQYTTMHNVLVSAGDKTSNEEQHKERQQEETSFWNKGLPRTTGFFPYQLISAPQKENNLHVEKQLYTITDWETVGHNKQTALHFDVWGYNSEKQVMIVIEKHGKSYPLFSSGKTRFLSPDSTFLGQQTFQHIIDELEKGKIAELTEKIEGKNGFDEQIKQHQEEKDATEIKLMKAEKNFSDIGYKTITTSQKPSKKVKKAKKQAVLRGVGADNWEAEPTTKASKKQKKNKQNTIVDLYQKFEWHRIKIKELKKEKQLAQDLRDKYQLKLDQYMQIRGYNWMKYTEKDGLYTFSDSTTFDIHTQDFIFPQSDTPEMFEMKLIAIPDSALAKKADPIMLHASLVDCTKNEDARIQKIISQNFPENKPVKLTNTLFEKQDSVAIRECFEALMQKEKPFIIKAQSLNTNEWDDSNPLSTNPWMSELVIHLKQTIELSVNTFINDWDEIPKINDLNKNILLIQTKNKLSEEQLICGYLTAEVLKKIKNELLVLAGRYLGGEDAKIINERLNQAYKKTSIQNGNQLIPLSSFYF